MGKEFPTWEEATKEIDIAFAEIPYKSTAIYGARIMYDILLRKNESGDGKNRQFKANYKIKGIV